VVALQHGKIRASDLPPDLQTDRSFLIGAVNKNTKIWYSLPDNFKNDISFARSITSYTDRDATAEILGELPPLVNERDVWSAIICNSPALRDWVVYSLVVSKAPTVIQSDRELMLKACSKNPDIIYDVLDETFARDGDFVRDLLTLDPQLLQALSLETQQMFPELVREFLPKALRNINRESKSVVRRARCISLARDIVSEFWQNRDFIRAWFQAGGPFCSGASFMASLKDDTEVFLWMAASFPKDDPDGMVLSFKCASATLLGDRDFMLQAIEHNPHIFHAARDSLRSDFDVWLVAFGGTPGEHPYIASDRWPRIRVGIAEFVPCVQAELHKHDTFVKSFVCGMSQRPNASPTALVLLNQGEATAQNYKQLIAVYLDIPTGRRLRMLRNASRVLPSVLTSVAKMAVEDL